MPEPLFQVVIDVVGRHYGTDASSILGRRHQRSTVIARQTAIYVARLVSDFSYAQIGEAFGREHSTVTHACQKMAKRRVQDLGYDQLVDKLVREVHTVGVTGGLVRIRTELLRLIEERVKLGIYGASIEDIVDRILCGHFQRELVQT